MPPIQPSLRGSLLTGASALALSLAGSRAQAQAPPGYPGPVANPQLWTIWIEGAFFETAGGNFVLPSVPGFGAPYTTFNQMPGIEGAFGFDYRWWPYQPWHFVFDIRYGQTGIGSANSSFFHSSVIIVSGHHFHNTSLTSDQATEQERHLVADFMVGRDLGIGSQAPWLQLQFGIRVADLWATASETGLSRRHFYSSHAPGDTRTISETAIGAWTSGFFGAGPRLAIVGDIPILGFWTFDYGAGVAGLFGDRSFNAGAITNTGVNYSSNLNVLAFVFNTDSWMAVSYWFTPYMKLSGGMRVDFYDSVLTTYNVNTGGLQNISRAFWGPFLRLTGSF